MTLDYDRFCEQITDESFRGHLSGADALIMPYFYMSVRYGDYYYNRSVQDPADTVYFLNLQDASLLFYLDRRKGYGFYVCGYKIRRENLKKAWFFMTPLIQSLRQEHFYDNDSDQTQFSTSFIENVSAFYNAALTTLVPFNFIISSMPDHCFPVNRSVRLFNRSLLPDVSKHLTVVTGKMVRDAAAVDGQGAYSSVFLVPPGKNGSKWQLEYYTNREVTKGKRRKAYGVIREDVHDMRSDGLCNMTALMKQVERMIGSFEGK